MRVIAVTGMPGAGKGLATEVAEDMGLPVVSMGDLVREATAAQGLPDEPASYGRVASELRAKEGAHAWAKRTLEHLGEKRPERLLIDGVRNLEEVEHFREAFPGEFCLVAVLAAPATRYQRMQERARGEDAADEGQLRERDLREIGYGLGAAIAMADIYVENEGDPDEARALLRAVLGAGT